MCAWVGETPSRGPVPRQEERNREKGRKRRIGRVPLTTLVRDGFMVAGLLSGPDKGSFDGRMETSPVLWSCTREKTMISVGVVR
jgi:hypothetical protein